MQQNVGGMDRTARLVVGVVLLAVGIAGYVTLIRVAVGPFPQFLTSVVIAVIGLILLVTGLTQTCPINSLLGRNTLRR